MCYSLYLILFVAYENLNLCIESFKQIRNIYYDKLESAELIPNYSFEVCLKNNFINKHFFKTKNPWYVMYRLNLYENKHIIPVWNIMHRVRYLYENQNIIPVWNLMFCLIFEELTQFCGFE